MRRTIKIEIAQEKIHVPLLIDATARAWRISSICIAWRNTGACKKIGDSRVRDGAACR